MIDGGVFIDRDPATGLGLGVDDIVRRLDRFGVGRALASTFMAVHFDSREGNALTAALCAGSDGRLLPMATLNLLGYDAGGDALADIKADDFLAVALFPALQYWSWSDYVAGKLAYQAARLDVALQAGAWTRQDMADIGRYIAPAGGRIMVRAMSGGGYKLVPDIIALAQDHPNLVFDVSTITQAGGIERLVERVGAERLYLASSMPLMMESASYFLLEAARLSDVDRSMIRSGTLEQMLALAPSSVTAEGDAVGAGIWEWMRDQPKVDTHWHTSGWNIVEPRTGFDAMSDDMSAFNYQLAVSSSIRALNYDLAAGNAETRAFTEADGRVRGLVVIDPNQVDASIAEIEKYKTDANFVGVKTIQDFYGKELSDPGYWAIFDHLQTMLGWPVMAHLPGMRQTAQRYRGINFVAAHSTWRYRDFVGLDNVWFDIATSTAQVREADLADLLEAVGEDRILFSSDGQLMSPAWTLGKLASAGLPESTLLKIFRENAFSAFPRLLAAGARPAQ